jgi:hypothetical protein
MQRSRYYQLGHRLGRLSLRLAIPSDRAALRLPGLGPGATVMLAVLLRSFLIWASH